MQQKLVKGGIVSGIMYELVVYKDSPASQVTRDLGDFMHVQQNACAAKSIVLVPVFFGLCTLYLSVKAV